MPTHCNLSRFKNFCFHGVSLLLNKKAHQQEHLFLNSEDQDVEANIIHTMKRPHPVAMIIYFTGTSKLMVGNCFLQL